METESVTFCHNNLRQISFLAFQDMRKKRELCDLTIKIQNRMIVAHRVVLAAGIPYFRSLFLKNSDEMEGNEISIGDVDPSALESLIHFAYGSKVNISVENVHSLLMASNFLELPEVRDACVEFLSERLHVYNVAEVCVFAHSLHNQELIDNCNVYAQQNFEEFSKSKGFASLPYPYIKDIISRDELNVSDEEIVFDAVINWVKFSPEKRHSMLPDLLREVRMTNLPVGYLIKHVATEKLIRDSSACKDIIQKVQSFHLLPEEDRCFLNLKTIPRRNIAKQIEKQIYAICDSKLHEHSLYCYDFSNELWYKLKSDKASQDAIFHIAAANDNVYLFLQNKIKILRLKRLQWEVLKSSYEHIRGSATVVQGHLIYFFGSLHFPFFDKVRSFDTRQNEWQTENRMATGRANTAATSVKESIYITGGRWKFNTLRTFEKYNPSVGQWSELSPMLVSRSLHGCASIHEKIYVFGGRSASPSNVSYSNSGEVYDLLTNLWSPITPMKNGRNRFSFATHCRKIYVFGGQSETCHPLKEVEFYDPECDQWKFCFSVPEGFVGAVVT